MAVCHLFNCIIFVLKSSLEIKHAGGLSESIRNIFLAWLLKQLVQIILWQCVSAKFLLLCVEAFFFLPKCASVTAALCSLE